MNSPKLALPPLPPYNPGPHAPALSVIRHYANHCGRDMQTDPEVFGKDLQLCARTETVLEAHRDWLALGWGRWMPWNLFRLLCALA
jgi:hypothetical protein